MKIKLNVKYQFLVALVIFSGCARKSFNYTSPDYSEANINKSIPIYFISKSDVPKKSYTDSQDFSSEIPFELTSLQKWKENFNACPNQSFCIGFNFLDLSHANDTIHHLQNDTDYTIPFINKNNVDTFAIVYLYEIAYYMGPHYEQAHEQFGIPGDSWKYNGIVAKYFYSLYSIKSKKVLKFGKNISDYLISCHFGKCDDSVKISKELLAKFNKDVQLRLGKVAQSYARRGLLHRP